MKSSEKYLNIKKDGKNVFEIFNELKKQNNSMSAMVSLREIFPELTLIEAKEIVVLSETAFKSLNDYQSDLAEKIKKIESDKTDL